MTLHRDLPAKTGEKSGRLFQMSPYSVHQMQGTDALDAGEPSTLVSPLHLDPLKQADTRENFSPHLSSRVHRLSRVLDNCHSRGD